MRDNGEWGNSAEGSFRFTRCIVVILITRGRRKSGTRRGSNAREARFNLAASSRLSVTA